MVSICIFIKFFQVTELLRCSPAEDGKLDSSVRISPVTVIVRQWEKMCRYWKKKLWQTINCKLVSERWEFYGQNCVFSKIIRGSPNPSYHIPHNYEGLGLPCINCIFGECLVFKLKWNYYGGSKSNMTDAFIKTGNLYAGTEKDHIKT